MPKSPSRTDDVSLHRDAAFPCTKTPIAAFLWVNSLFSHLNLPNHSEILTACTIDSTVACEIVSPHQIRNKGFGKAA